MPRKNSKTLYRSFNYDIPRDEYARFQKPFGGLTGAYNIPKKGILLFQRDLGNETFRRPCKWRRIDSRDGTYRNYYLFPREVYWLNEKEQKRRVDEYNKQFE